MLARLHARLLQRNQRYRLVECALKSDEIQPMRSCPPRSMGMALGGADKPKSNTAFSVIRRTCAEERPAE